MCRLLAPTLRVVFAAAILIGARPHAAVAQGQSGAPRAAGAVQAPQAQARDVRTEFRQVLERYPPVLGKMLKLDPGLMGNQTYLAPYPAISAYLQQHPEIPRDPAYFLDFVNTGDNRLSDPETWRQERMFRAWNDFLVGVMVVCLVVAACVALAWIVRFVIEHRRWLRATKIQSDIQTRLLERMGSSNELLAYVQSPAGQSLLQGVPVSIDPAPARNIVAPLTRILLSIQIGFILASGGAGLLVARSSLGLDYRGIALVIGTTGLSLGIGFGLAAGASYLLLQRFGLLDTNADKMRPSGGI